MRTKITFFVGFVFMLGLLGSVGVANDKNPQQSLKKKDVQKLVTRSIMSSDVAHKIENKYRKIEDKKTKLQANFVQSIEKNKNAQILHQQAINSLSEADRIKAFILGIRKMRAEGLTTQEIHQALQQRLSLRKSTQSGSISGKVTTSNQDAIDDAMIFAFDMYGYLAGEATSNYDGTYTIGDLPAGLFYVATESGYVDKFYNDVLLNDFENWRIADKVNVPENTNVPDINFELIVGGVISGVVSDTSGNPLGGSVVYMTLFSPDDQDDIILEETVFPSFPDGKYEIVVGDVGAYKISASLFPGQQGVFYDNKLDWNSADLVEMVTPGDTVKDINFTLSYEIVEPPVEAGNVISGAVTSEIDGSLLNLVLVFAFDTSDSSIAGFSISGGFPFAKVSGTNAPNYFIGGLEQGSYIVMATDLVSTALTNQPGYSREFYQEVNNPDDATPVTFTTDNDTAKAVDFTLDFGGSISGKLTDESGASLQGVIVIALKGSLDFDPFFTNLDIGFATTDTLGNYIITGLSSGEYVLRTLSLLNEEYEGIYLDEWYDNIYNILAFNEATKVAVIELDETPDIDFQLDKAGAITGKITASDGTTPVSDVAIVVVIDTSNNLPQLASFEYTDDNTGDYLISMLEPGNFKLYAFVDPESEGMYLSEFYNGVSSYNDAMVVSTVIGDTTENVNFTLELGGMIQGFVFLNSQLSAGADTLSDFPVVAYDASTGEFAGAAPVTFTGGFRIPGLPEGEYKLVALPVLSPYAATYFGGGNTYDDGESSVVSVISGATQNADIILEQANGEISGTVTDGESNDLVNGVFVFAYDETGHASGAGMSGINMMTDKESGNPGVYMVEGLRTGNYYVRTYAFFGLIQSVFSVDAGEGTLDDPFSIIGDLGDLFSGNLYKDEWYDDVSVDLPELSVNSVVGILEDLRFTEFGLIPFYQTIPGVTAQSSSAITSISVTDGSTTGNINFVLGKFGLDDFPVSVENNNMDQVPTAFQLGQSYPNPIHQNELGNGITINFELIETKNIVISVYNVLGQKVASILNNEVSAGFHSVQWNGKDNQGNFLPSGVYFYALSSEMGSRHMKKLIILR